MDRLSPAPCSALAATISRDATNFWPLCAGRIPNFKSREWTASLAMTGVSSSGFSFPCRPRAADPGAVTAGTIVAPALGPGPGRIVENPSALGISAHFHPLHLLIGQHFS